MEEELTARDADEHIRGVCFKTGPPALVGIEIEWVVHDLADPLGSVEPARIDRALETLSSPGALPGGSALSREPGGQVELSSRPGPLLGCLRDLAADVEMLRTTLAGHGMALAGWGLEPFQERARVLDLPRYQAMEAHFDRGGPWGRRMMRSTAGLQVNLDAGDGGPDGAGTNITGWRTRWDLAHRLGPVLVAAFANSPLWLGKPTGWHSGRQLVWARMDASRTRPPAHSIDPRTAWADYVLDAALLCIRNDGPGSWNAPPGLTMRGWLNGEYPGLRPPTVADVDYHMTTLFPPVRPRGWLELRMIDTQHGDEWLVASAVATVLFDDRTAAETAWAATEPLVAGGHGPIPGVDMWERAARLALSAPELRKAALTCFAAAEKALADIDGADSVRQAVSTFTERYVARGRCPADDRLDALRDRASSFAPPALEEAWR
jgi:ergothioneine biosynthesis glutamate--cysteine ligase EgtA